MSRIFKNEHGAHAANWFPDNSGVSITCGVIYAQDVPAFIEWLSAGPPKPKYRITKTFDKKPSEVRIGRTVFYDSVVITDNDIEEVL